MIRIAVIGAGVHSRQHHLPALARLRRERPETVALAAVCDLDAARAADAARAFGFTASFSDPDAMLRRARPDACLVLTPVAVTCPVACRVLARGIAALVEKPPGVSPDEARAIAAAAARSGAQAMVSMNRRYDPVLTAGLAAAAGRPVRYARGAMLRSNRLEPRFLLETGLHALDALVHLAGPVRRSRPRCPRGPGANWLALDLEFAGGVTGTLELLPTCGTSAERYELYGEGWRVVMRSAWRDNGVLEQAEAGRPPVERQPFRFRPLDVRSGTYAETAAFVEALDGRRPFYPTIEEVLPGMEILNRLVPPA